MKYRPEIDGLRALAVLPVILFHADITPFSGGFIGVDVFFVISGYLITSILINDIETNNFSVMNFYERRARRILPALFFVMLICLPFAWLWLLPSQLKDFSQSLVAVSFFVSNLLFFKESDYFAAASEEKPLLHTWSLAVEEQYYFIFPIFLILAWRLGRDRTFWLIVIVAACSLALSEWSSRHFPTANFYLAHTRAWELLAGSLSAFIVHKRGIRSNSFFAFLGLLAILISIFVFDKHIPFPGLYALLPVIGVVAIILFAGTDTLTAKLLSTRYLVGIGLISYSAYLWHQPLFAFLKVRYASLASEINMLILSILTFAIAYLSWRFIEKPFRQKDRVSRNSIALFSILGITFFSLIGVAGHFGNGFEFRLTENQRNILQWKNYPRKEPYMEGECFLEEDQTFENFSAKCFQPGEYVIWGDSHAAALASGWRQLAPLTSQLTASACPPFAGQSFPSRPNCKTINSLAIDSLIKQPGKTIILHANWHNYSQRNLKALSISLAKLKESGLNKIYVLGSVPQYYPSLPELLARKEISLNAQYKSENTMKIIAEKDQIIKKLAASAGARYISMIDLFCDSQHCLTVIDENNGYEPVAWDYGHLTQTGALHASKQIIQKITK